MTEPNNKIDDGNFYVCALHGKVPYNEKLLCICGNEITPVSNQLLIAKNKPVTKNKKDDLSPRTYRYSQIINNHHETCIEMCLE